MLDPNPVDNPQQCCMTVSHKSFPQERILQDCPTSVFCKSIPQECCGECLKCLNPTGPMRLRNSPGPICLSCWKKDEKSGVQARLVPIVVSSFEISAKVMAPVQPRRSKSLPSTRLLLQQGLCGQCQPTSPKEPTTPYDSLLVPEK